MEIYIKYLFCFFGFIGFAQNNLQKDSIPSHQISLLNSDYKDFVSVKNIIYAITQNNDFVSVDFKNDSFKTLKNNITAIAKKSNNELLLGSKEGEIFIYNKNQKIKKIDRVKSEIFSILLNSADEYIVHSSKSIYYNKKHYIPEKETVFYGKVMAKYKGTQLIASDYIFLDKMNFVWFTFDEGEWGGHVSFFDLNKKKFIYDDWLRLDFDVKFKDKQDYFNKLKDKYPDIITIKEKDTVYQYPYNLNISSRTKGVVYDKENSIFMSSSGGNNMIYQNLEGFNYFVDGTLVRISKTKNDIYKSCFNEKFLLNEKYREAFGQSFLERMRTGGDKKNLNILRENILTENEINVLGPISFNQYDNKLYMYCSKGFHVVENMNCNFTKELAFKPNLTCKVQYEQDYCIHLNVIKFEFISEKEILFLTTNNGIGYYNGDEIKYLR